MIDERLRNLIHPDAKEPPTAASRSTAPSAGPSFETRPAGAPQDEAFEMGATRPPQHKDHKQRRREKRDVHGWIVLDKPVGMTSTHAVSVIKRLFTAKRAGHAGTLDPLASGILPLALGEATKTVPFLMDADKAYRFMIQWGRSTTTLDREGETTDSSDVRPTREAVEAALPAFIGEIDQIPPN